MKSTSHDDTMAALSPNDPVLAADLLDSILKNGDQAALLTALRQLSLTFGAGQSVVNGKRV